MSTENNNRPRRKIQEAEPIEIPWYHNVYMRREGAKHAEVNHFMRQPKVTIQKIDKYKYRVLSTGEEKYYKLGKKKNVESMRKSMVRLRGLIRCNFGIEPKNEEHITLTYHSNMTDPEKLMNDFELWFKRLKYHYRKQYKFQYIAIAEPQSRGAWHMHLLIKADKPMWLSYRKVRRMWRKTTGEPEARTRHEKIPAVDDIGVYFVAYFTTVIPEAAEAAGKEAIKKASKAVQKGSRLYLYPPYFKFYRCSRGIVRPVSEIKKLGAVVQEYGEPKKQKRFKVYEDEMQEKPVQAIQKMSFEK
jgi:hypothetical protein